MKKKFLTLMLTLFCLCGAVACSGSGNAAQRSVTEQEQTTENECPDGNCPKENECPDGNCPKENDCPDGNCPKEDDCPDGNCPKEKHRNSRKIPVRPVHPIPPTPDDPLFPPKFPIRPTPPLPEPNL